MKKLVIADSVRSHDSILGNTLLIEDGVLAAIGDDTTLSSPGIVEERFPGATIIPGLRDAHLHPIWYADLLAGMSLKSAASIAQVQSLLRKAAAADPDKKPIHAPRLDDDHLAERRLPTALELDAAVADRPVIVTRYCGHVAAANTMALQAAGIQAATQDPAGGIIDRDANGVPNGILRETAIEIVLAAVPRPRVQAGDLVKAMRALAGLGLTSIGAMLRYGDEVDAMVEVASQLPLKVYAYVIAESASDLTEARNQIGAAGPRLMWRGLKRFADGSLGARTAALSTPFSDVDTIGTLRLTEHDTMLAKVSIALGGDVAFHGIGDAAVAAILDSFESLIASGCDPRRLRIEHASVLTGDLVERIARAGVIASVQPAFLVSEADWLESRIGPQRVPFTYPLRSLIDAGVLLAGGSDCPVEPPNPFWGMAAAIDRAGIAPNQALTASQALALFTVGGAAALKERAPLGVGSPADFVVIDRDPITSTPDELRATVVSETYVDGVAVPTDSDARWWDE